MGLIEGLVTVISGLEDARLRKTEKRAPAIPRRLTPTQRKLAKMFMQHISTSILDSGGSYGYGYQFSRENPEWEKPQTRFEFDPCYGDSFEMSSIVSTYHLLSGQLDYVSAWNTKFQKWVRQWYAKDEDWEEHLEEFKHPGTGELCTGSGGDWYSKSWVSGYTYNDETLLDRDFIYYKYGDLIIIQIHNGCDARGGFTSPVLFNIEYWNEFNPYVGASAHCPECNSYWDYSLYYLQDSTDGKDLRKDYPFELGTEGKAGTLVIREDSRAFCPICGKGLIEGEEIRE